MLAAFSNSWQDIKWEWNFLKSILHWCHPIRKRIVFFSFQFIGHFHTSPVWGEVVGWLAVWVEILRIMSISAKLSYASTDARLILAIYKETLWLANSNRKSFVITFLLNRKCNDLNKDIMIKIFFLETFQWESCTR